jgi:predicted amidohydrolase YtcJ
MKCFIFFLTAYLSMANLNSQDMKIAFINGKIFTVNEIQPLAESVISENEKIIFVGSNIEANSFIDDKTTVIDLKGRLMLPGFNDAHLHFISGGFYLLGINLRPAKSLSEFKDILHKYISKNEGRWITGGRWDHESWLEKKFPRKEDIDPFSQTTPIFVSRIDGHVGLANSLALKLAGITSETENPEGGLIEKDQVTGEPTGILKDNAMDLIFKIIPEKTIEENSEALVRSLEEAKRLGITSVNDITEKNQVEVYQKFDEQKKLTCRVYSIYPINNYEELISEGIQVGSGNNFLMRGGLKAFSDGSLGASTAWFFEHYQQDTTVFGLPNDIVLNGELEEWAVDADAHKLQLCTHAIGDKANSFMLNLYEKIAGRNPLWDRRFRIEHAQHLREVDIHRFAKLGVIASVQPYHCIDDGVWAEKRIGKDRLKFTHAYRTFLDDSVTLAFGTDWPVAPLNPLLGIYAAVTRRTVDGQNPGGWIPEQKISVEEAIKCYTLNSAYASFQEKIKGSIEVGKLADLIVLSDDILTIDPVKIKDAKIDMTIFNGVIIYQNTLTKTER